MTRHDLGNHDANVRAANGVAPTALTLEMGALRQGSASTTNTGRQQSVTALANDEFTHAMKHHETLRYVLTASEESIISDAFHKGAGSFVSLSTLEKFLSALGIQCPAQPSLLEGLVRRAIEKEEDDRKWKRSSANGTATSAEIMAHLHAHPNPTGHSHLHRAVTRVLSARKISARLSARSHTTDQPTLPPHHSAPTSAAPQKLIPPTLSLSLVFWVCRLLKEELLHQQQTRKAEDNPDTIEAFKSCVDDGKGVVTLESIKARCTEFDLKIDTRLLLNGKSEAEEEIAEVHSERYDDSEATEHEISTKVFARLIQGTEGAKPDSHDARVKPMFPRSPSAEGRRHDFTSVPYSESELRWFQDAEEMLSSPERLRGTGKSDYSVNLFTNALLGEEPEGDAHRSEERATWNKVTKGTLAAVHLSSGVMMNSETPRSVDDSQTGLLHRDSSTLAKRENASSAAGSYFLSRSSPVKEDSVLHAKLTEECSRHYAHFQSASHSGMPGAVAQVGGIGGGFLKDVDDRQHQVTHSTLLHPSQAKGRSHMSLGIENNFDRFFEQQSPEGRSTSADHQNHHIVGFQLSDMVEKQNSLKKTHATRASVMGSYYHDIDQERSQYLSSSVLQGAGTTLSVGQQLDLEFPLKGGLSWRTGEKRDDASQAQHHAAKNRRAASADVFSRLTHVHAEKPAVSLFKLQQRLSSLQTANSRNDGRPSTSQSSSSVERLKRFHRISSPERTR